MSQIKLSELLEKTGMSFDNARKKLKGIGVDVSSENSMIDQDAAKQLGVETSSLSIDKRQEMLRKAMERHKRYSKAKEVLVKNSDSDNSRKISREDLIKKKIELENSLKKVDEKREKEKKEKDLAEKPVEEIKDLQGSAEVQNVTEPPKGETVKETPVSDSPEKTVPPNVPTDISEKNKDNVSAEKREPKFESKTETVAAPKKSEHGFQRSGNQTGDRDNRRPQNRYSSQTHTDRPKTDRPSYDRNQPGRPPRQDWKSRPQGDTQGRRPPYNSSQGQGQSQGQNQGNRPPRPAGQGRDFNRDRSQQTTQQGDRKPFVRRDGTNVRTDANKTRQQYPRKKEFEVEAEDSFDSLIKPEIDIKVDEKKKKDTEKEDLEAKKAKAKKGTKKEKNIVKNIMEGIDELELEEKIVKGEQIDDETIVESEVEDVKQTDKKTKQVRGRKKDRPREKYTPLPVKITQIDVGENIALSELAGLMGIKAVELVKKLFGMGVAANVNQSIDGETVQLLGTEYGIDVHVKSITEEDLMPRYQSDPSKFVTRSPIVTVMGHVDHGKTSLLDAIRKTDVAEGEAGGITQHIGAYEVSIKGRSITFLDTPGHEAFTTLRARGANVTDIVILVVAADDGVMPQTKEAIDHAKAAGVRIVVAVNKIDKPNANPDKVKTQLADYGIIPDEWGGEFQFQNISAKNKIGIEDLLERVLLEADVLELKADPDRLAEGIIIESKLDKQKGPVATVLIKEGTIKNGDFFVVGPTFGKIRAIFDYKGKSLKSAGPATPVEIMGFSSVPTSGENFTVLPNEKTARQIADLRLSKQKDAELKEKSKVSLTDIFSRIKDGEIKELNIIVKGDVQGSVEALKTSFAKLSSSEVKVNVIHDGVGGINESDVLLASASNAIIIGFNVRPDNNARSVAEREDVEIDLYSVIYEAIDDVKKAIGGLLSPEVKENIIGKVHVRQVFSVPKIGKIAGSYVLEGKITRNGKVRVIRDNVVVYEGIVGSLKRFSDDAKEVLAGYECGVGVDKFNDLKENDIFEVFELVEHKREFKDIK